LGKGYKIRQKAKIRRLFVTKTGLTVFNGRTEKQAGIKMIA
jgi:hypothetical protein